MPANTTDSKFRIEAEGVAVHGSGTRRFEKTTRITERGSGPSYRKMDAGLESTSQRELVTRQRLKLQR